MSEQAAEGCGWDQGCHNPATIHANWQVNEGGRRDKHLCGAHTAELREREPPCDLQEQPITCCGASCPNVLARL